MSRLGTEQRHDATGRLDVPDFRRFYEGQDIPFRWAFSSPRAIIVA